MRRLEWREWAVDAPASITKQSRETNQSTKEMHRCAHPMASSTSTMDRTALTTLRFSFPRSTTRDRYLRLGLLSWSGSGTSSARTMRLLCHVVSCRVILCRVILCHVMLFDVMSSHVMSCRVMCQCRAHVVSCHIVSCRAVGRVISCRVISCHVVSYHVVSFYVMPCHVISCRVMSYRVMPCDFMSYHVMSCHIVSCVVSYHVVPCHVMSCQQKRQECSLKKAEHLCMSKKNAIFTRSTLAILRSLRRAMPLLRRWFPNLDDGGLRPTREKGIHPTRALCSCLSFNPTCVRTVPPKMTNGGTGACLTFLHHACRRPQKKKKEKRPYSNPVMNTVVSAPNESYLRRGFHRLRQKKNVQ